MRISINNLKDMKDNGHKIPMLTAYDYTSAKIIENAGIELILVGDSLGQVMLGLDSTLPVTMDDMTHHIKAVVRGTERAHVVGDLPFLSYQVNESEAVKNAGRFLKEGGAQSVKLEGGRHIANTVAKLVQSGIPVMGHIGLTPQSVNQLGGYHVQGKSAKAAIDLMEDARILMEAGVYAIVLESIPAPLAKLITERVTIPTIGIGSGIHCDGQVQVFHDIFGLFDDFSPRHARRYTDLGTAIKLATTQYITDVQTEIFPSDKESYSMKQTLLEELMGQTSTSSQIMT